MINLEKLMEIIGGIRQEDKYMRFLRTSVRIKNTLYNSNNSMDDAS